MRNPFAVVVASLLPAVALAVAGGCGGSQSASSRPADDAPLLGDASSQPVIAAHPEVEAPVFSLDGSPSTAGKVPDLPKGLALPSGFGAADIAGTLPLPHVDSDLVDIPVPKPVAGVTPRRGVDEFKRGVKLANLKRWEDAVVAFEESLELDPTRAETYLNLGIVCLAENDELKALPNLDAAIRLDPNNALAYANRATANMRLNYLAKARADLNRAIELDPKAPLPLLTRANLNVIERRHEAAIDDCTSALAIHPGILDAYQLRCLSHLCLNQLNAARSDYDTALEYGLAGGAKTMMESWFKQVGNPIQPKRK